MEALAASILSGTWAGDEMDMVQITISDSGKTRGKKTTYDTIEMSGMYAEAGVLSFNSLTGEMALDGGNFTIHVAE